MRALELLTVLRVRVLTNTEMPMSETNRPTARPTISSTSVMPRAAARRDAGRRAGARLTTRASSWW